ncbi:MAG: polyprenol monophosphomannose synthase [Candidatus Bathyarchaeia archaeon]
MISFVIPTRNEPMIQILIRDINSIMNEIGGAFEVIIVDLSDDDTPLRAKGMGAKIYRQSSEGLGGALKEGLELAKGDIIFTMDGDLSHDPAFIPKFLTEISKGFDIVVGSRRIKGGKVIGWGLRRRMTSWTANTLGRLLAGVKVSDLTSGYRAYKKEVLRKLNLKALDSKGYAFQLEILFEALKHGLRVGAVPIVFRDRTKGASKLGLKEIIEFFRISLRLFLKRLASSGLQHSIKDI